MSTLSPAARQQTYQNILSNLLSQVIILGTTFITSPYIVNKLGSDAYGIVVLIGTFLSYLSLMDLGLGDAAIRYLTEYASTGEWERFRRTAWSSLIVYACIGLVGAASLFFLIPTLVTDWLAVPPQLQSAGKIAFYIGTLAFIMTLMQQVPRAILWSYHRIDKASLLVLLNGTSQPLLSVGSLFLGYGLIGVSVGTLLSSIIGLISGIWMSAQLYRFWGKPIWDSQTIKPLLRFGSWLTVATIINQLITSLDKILLGKYQGSAYVGYYSLSTSLPSRLWVLYGAFNSTLLPLLINLKARQASSKEYLSLMSRSLYSMKILSLPIFLFFIFWGEAFLHAWINKDFSMMGTLGMQISAIGTLLLSLNGIGHIFLQAWGRTDLIVKGILGATVIYLPLLYVLVQWLGIPGAALAQLGRIIGETLWLLLQIRRLVGIPVYFWLSILLSRHSLILTGLAVLMSFLQSYFTWPPLWKVIGLGAPFLLLSGAYVWFVGIPKTDRQAVLRTLLRRAA